MPLLTRDLLDPSRLTYWGEIIRRGRDYYNRGLVTITHFDGESATCSVRGTKTYTVTLKAAGKSHPEVSCDCPYAAKGNVCKHIVAAALAVRDRLEEMEKRWDYRLQLALEQAPQPKAETKKEEPYFLLYGLFLDETPLLFPYIIQASRWPQTPLEPLSPEAFAQYLEDDRSWQYVVTRISPPLNPYACLNLPPETVQTCNLMLEAQSPYYYPYRGSSDFSKYLLILARQKVPVFRLTSPSSFCERLNLLDQPVTLEMRLVRSRDGIAIDLGGRVGDTVFSNLKQNFRVISTRPAWALMGNYVVPVANPEVLDIAPRLSVNIPLSDEALFRDRFLPRLAERLPVSGDVVEMEEILAGPVPRLYLREEEGAFRATLAFGYGDHEVEFGPKAPGVHIVSEPGTWTITRIHRQRERETHYHQMLTDVRYGLKRAGREFGPAVFQLRARTHPLDFLTQCIPLLAEAGFEIYGQEGLKSARLSPATPTLRVFVSSGIDWFDIEAVVAYGDQTVSLKEVLKAIRQGGRYIKLADGTFGQVPEKWLERYQHLFGIAEETEKGVRLHDTQLPLVDPLLADAAEVQAAQDFQERRERLGAFERITPQPLPRGFHGELRSYQKAGLDWLHFLHEYRFGGVLADDMGLGKTIQVLAFLQSLKERGEAEQPSLLVVPKSLLVNWQRETARFTPELRVLEFTGAGRKRDPSFFDQYDIVITTYGTMLRDVEFLRSYRFQYVILDESQAIKNPLAKTTRAACLLNTDHRLVMTGTPVENTTFELWSQFAFVNPGMLGGLQYFQETFAKPIEQNQDEEAANLLRKLVYPFILRRTKAQVAPELPPRSERVLFTDLEPAQRKIYSRLRDRYRAELLRLIDQSGMEDARMRILEGLLRLRQVCIHPALVEPTYRGEAAKFELLADILGTLLREGHKALIYSQFVEVLKLVRRHLESLGVRYAYLDGKTRDRQAQVDLFQSDPDVPFFLLSLKAGGVGLNLTAAEYVIHLDPWWNPAVEMQAADRAHRIGQENPVFIYKFIARDTVEEKILQLQERKRDLVEQLISAESGFFKSLTREDVAVLFS